MSWIYLGTFVYPSVSNYVGAEKWTVNAYLGQDADEGYFQYQSDTIGSGYKYHIAKDLCPFKVVIDDEIQLLPTYKYSDIDKMVWGGQSYSLYDDVLIQGLVSHLSYVPYTYRYMNSSGEYVYGGRPCWKGRLERINVESTFEAAGSITGEADKKLMLKFQDDVYVSNTKYGVYTNVYDSSKKKLFGNPTWSSNYGIFVQSVGNKVNDKPVIKCENYTISWNGSEWRLSIPDLTGGYYKTTQEPKWNESFTMNFVKTDETAEMLSDLVFTPTQNLSLTDETKKGLLGDLPIWI